MMNVRHVLFNRSILGGLAVLLSACTGGEAGQLEAGRATPVLEGRLTSNNEPVAGARIAVVLYEAGKQPPSDGCGTSISARQTDDSGAFLIPSRVGVLAALGALVQREREASPPNERFAVCVRLSDAPGYQKIFEGPAHRWDTLSVACDLKRAWLTPDREGRTGQCVVRHAILDHVGRLPGPPAGSLSPDLTCNTDSAVIQPLRVGPVRVNGSVAELRRLCPSLRDTTVDGEGWMDQGYRQPVLVLTIAGTPVIIEDHSGVIASITIRTPGLVTEDSIGVGTPLARLINPNLYMIGDSDLMPFAVAWHGEKCGLAYYLTQPEYKAGRTNPAGLLSAGVVAARSKTNIVRRVIVGFCPSPRYHDLLRR
jgi:hypothetical protein